MKLLIVSHTPHYLQKDRIVGWGPTVREIDCLADIFESIVHIAPLHPEPAPASALPYQNANSRFVAVSPAGGSGLRAKGGILRVIPRYCRRIFQEMQEADVIHVRCPANISLVALVMLALLRKPKFRWVKYAGNWRPQSREPWSYFVQRWYLKLRLHGGVTTVNGTWPDQSPHIYSFLNPCLTTKELDDGERLGITKKLCQPVNLLYVGRLEKAKGVERVLQIAAELHKRQFRFELYLVGDGPERPQFELHAQQHDLSGQVFFLGWLPRPRLAQYYARAHFLLFPSSSDGWPKVLSETMAYGAVPIAGAVSSIPQILEQTDAGIALPADDTEAFVQTVLDLCDNPEKWQAMSRAGIASAKQFSYAAYLAAVAAMFARAWGVHFSRAPENSPPGHAALLTANIATNL